MRGALNGIAAAVFFCFAVSVYLYGCGGGSSPSSPVVQDSKVHYGLTVMRISSVAPSTYNVPALGYKVYVSLFPGYDPNALSFDVGLVSECPISQIISSPGDWYVSVAEYDVNGESARSTEIMITADVNMGFSSIW